MSTGQPETMRQLIATIEQGLTEHRLPWDGFTAIAWFETPTGPASIATWCYRCDDRRGRLVGSAPAAAALFARLRDAVTGGPVGALVLTQVRASGATALQTVAPNDPALRSTLAPGREPHQLGAALRPAELPFVGTRTRGLSVWRPDPDAPTGAVPDDLLPRLSAEEARRLADYLDAGAVVARTTFRIADPWSGNTRPEVMLTKRTDGTWHWDDAVAHYVRRYGLNPDPEFVDHARLQGFLAPTPSPSRVSEVIDQLFGGATEPGPAWGLRLDSTQVLPSGMYCTYGDQVLLHTASEGARVRLGVPPGAVIPPGFDPVDDRAADRPAIAYGTVPAQETSTFRLVVTGCRYKGAKARVIKVTGKHWLIRIDATADRREGYSAPTVDEWALFPDVRVIAPDHIITWIDAFEASQVHTLLIRCQPILDRVVPMWDILGPSTNPDEPDSWLYCHPSAADSPYLPPAQARAVLAERMATSDPEYPLAGALLRRLRHGWRLNVDAPVHDAYYVDDDGEVFTCPAGVPAEKVSEMLTMQLVKRHAAINPPGGEWPF